MTRNIIQRAETIIGAGKRCTNNRNAQMQLDAIQLYRGYAEPGYESKNDCVAVGNWNNPSWYHQESGRYITQDTTVSRVADLLERLGVDLEWEDEWTLCGDCGLLFRIQPDSYSWQRHGVIVDGECYCADCTAKDAESYLESLEGQDNHCNTIQNIDPADHGYQPVAERLEHGFHPGQDADPRVIAAKLRELGIKRFLFNLNGKGQFDLRFSAWVHDSEADKLEAAKELLSDRKNTDGPSVSDGLKQVLRAASTQSTTSS